MTIRKLNLQSVIDEEAGFQLSRESRSYLRYAEHDLVLLVEVESGEDDRGKYNLAVYWPAKLSWNPPHDQVVISADRRQEIRDRVERSLKLLEIPSLHVDM